MKILHVETGRHLYGGPQQVLYLMTALAERGHDGTLVCPPGSGIDSAARTSGISVQNLYCAGDLDLPFAYRLGSYIKESRPDLVHCHSRRGADILGGLAASFTDVPAVVSRRVDNTEMKLTAALRYRPFRKIIAISEAIAAVLRDRGIDDERIVVIRDAVDVDAFERAPDCDAFRREFQLPAKAFVIAAAGQLIERKGHRFLLDALKDIPQSHPRCRLLLFGEGPLEAGLRDQAHQLGLSGQVTFAGFREDLDRWFGCFDLFVHPALAEGLGVVTLKASAAGVPVIAFDAGGVSEAVAHDETGVLVAPEDVRALSDAITGLIDDEQQRQRLGAAARKRMQNEFSIATMADRHVELYESLL